MNIRLISLHLKFLNHHLRKTVELLKVKYIAILLLTIYHNFHHNRLQELQEKYNMAFFINKYIIINFKLFQL